VRRNGHARLAALVVAGLVLGGACGGDDDDSSAEPEAAAEDASTDADDGAVAPDEEAPDEADVPVDEDPTASPADIPDIPDGNWNSGRIHVEVTGDSSASFESDGTGQTTGGFTAAEYNANPPNRVNIGLSDGQSAIGIETGEVATTGTFGQDCDIEFTSVDASGVSAEFTCEGLPAVSSSSTDTYTIDVTGNFTLAP
jgi:hypothetical protein